MKIYTKRAFEFRNHTTQETVQTAFMGFTVVPDWVRNDLMFRQGVSTGSISVIETAAQQKALENGVEDTELTDLRARGKELGIKNASQMGKEKLKAAVTAAEEALKAASGASEAVKEG